MATPALQAYLPWLYYYPSTMATPALQAYLPWLYYYPSTMAIPALQAYTPPATLGATLISSLDVLIMSAAWLCFVAVWTGGWG